MSPVRFNLEKHKLYMEIKNMCKSDGVIIISRNKYEPHHEISNVVVCAMRT